jgi:hypothetical protein
MQIPTCVNTFGVAGRAFHFLARRRDLGCRGEQIVYESSVLSDLGVSKARKTIPAVYNPSRIRILTHHYNLGYIGPDGIRYSAYFRRAQNLISLNDTAAAHRNLHPAAISFHEASAHYPRETFEQCPLTP